MEKQHSFLRALKKVFIILAAVVVFLTIAIQIVLSGPVLTHFVRKYVPAYVDGNIQIGKVSGGIITSFPRLKLCVEDLYVTYPHGRFSDFDSLGVDGRLLHLGRGEFVDTLASLSRLELKINPFALLEKEYHIPVVNASGLRLYAHSYDTENANWNIIRIPDSAEEEALEEDEGLFPKISIDRLRLDGHPHIVYTDQSDTVYAYVCFSSLNFRGVIQDDILHNLGKDGGRSKRERLSFSLDSLFVTGRMPADTVAVSFHHLDLFEHKDHIDVGLSADAMLFTRSFGRLKIPVEFGMELGFPRQEEEGFRLELIDLDTKLASLPLEASGDIIMRSDSTYLKISADIKDCPLGALLDEYGRDLSSELKTDATVSLSVNTDGWLNLLHGTWPRVEAHLEVPSSVITYSGLIDDGEFDLDLDAYLHRDGRIDARVNDLCLAFRGLDLLVAGSMEDVTGEDPLLDVTAFFCTQFEDLMRFLPEDSGIEAYGDVDIELDGKALLSQLNLYSFSRTSLTGRLYSDDLMLSMPDSGLFAMVKNPDIRLVTAGKGKGVELVATVDSLSLSSGKDTYIKSNSLSLAASNGGELLDSDGKMLPLQAELKIGGLNMLSTDSLMVALRGSDNHLTLTRIETHGDSLRPRYSVHSSNSAAYVKSKSLGRVTLQNVDISASAQMRPQLRAQERRSRMPQQFRAQLDSLQRIHPGASKDSLLKMAAEAFKLPDYLSEKEFRLHDIKIDLGESTKAMLRNWRPDATLSVAVADVATPLLPLRNRISSLQCSLSDDNLKISNMQINSGTSSLNLMAEVSGLEPVLQGRRAPLGLTALVESKRLNLNELIAASYAGGSLFVEDASDDSYITDTLANAKSNIDYSLIVVPANLNAEVVVDVDSLDYSYLSIGKFRSDVAVRERCIQLTNTMASAEFGNVSLDGFYATRTKQDISAGFNLGFTEITAEKVIELIPEVDSLVPMLSSFKGLLNCELAATTQLDTNMNVILPSLNGVVKLNGKDLELRDSQSLRRIAKMLMFKDTRVSKIDEMSINGIISNNQLEIFPFILKVDRYTLGMNGLQQFDSNFRYHVSVIKSPLPFKFGVNLKGNFDDWSYSLCKARYKSTRLPVYTSQVEDVKVNLAASIKDIFHKGVDLALRENSSAAHGLKQTVVKSGLESDDEMLSGEELKQMDDYLMDTEIERQSQEIEQEIESMFDDMFDPTAFVSPLNADSHEDSLRKEKQSIHDRMHKKSDASTDKVHRRTEAAARGKATVRERAAQRRKESF